MRISVRLWVSSVVAASLIALSAEAAQKPAAPSPALWRVSDADSSVYLFGTFGVLPKGGQWRSRALAGAIDAAEVVWFETPVFEPAAAARANVIFAAEGRPPAGKKLSSLIGKERWDAYAGAAASAGMSVEALDGLAPWAAFVVLSSRMHASQGIDLAEGVDAALAREAASRGRRVRYFDTMDESLSVLTTMPQSDQIDLLAFLLADWDRQRNGAAAAFEDWRAGDAVATDAYLNAAMRETAPAAYARLVSARTEALAGEIAEILNGRDTAFIALNAGYTVGDGALPETLSARGLKVERIADVPALTKGKPALRQD